LRNDSAKKEEVNSSAHEITPTENDEINRENSLQGKGITRRWTKMPCPGRNH